MNLDAGLVFKIGQGIGSNDAGPDEKVQRLIGTARLAAVAGCRFGTRLPAAAAVQP